MQRLLNSSMCRDRIFDRARDRASSHMELSTELITMCTALTGLPPLLAGILDTIFRNRTCSSSRESTTVKIPFLSPRTMGLGVDWRSPSIAARGTAACDLRLKAVKSWKLMLLLTALSPPITASMCFVMNSNSTHG